MDEKIADNRINKRRNDWNPESQIGCNRHAHTTRGFGKRPNNAHSFCPGFQMMEMNFEFVAVDDLFRGPGDWDAGTHGCHDHQVAIAPTLQKSDVAVMRQNLWP